MEFVARLRRLWRHRAFRRLLSVRITTQTGDGIVQVGMASYVLFSPQNAPSAWAIAAVLALTLLPFSVVGPFVSVALDRWPRQRIAMITDIARAGICATLAGLIMGGVRAGSEQVALYGLLLLALSFNRFMLAGLAAGIPFTVDDDEYLDASSVMPMIGPAGLMVGGAVAAATRLILGAVTSVDTANAVIFLIAAGTFCLSVTFASAIARLDLGPIGDTSRTTVREVWVGLTSALAYLKTRTPAVQSLAMVGTQRLTYGMLMTCMILAYRNHFHSDADLPAAMADMGIWFLVSGIGYVLSGVVAPMISLRIGLRKTIIVLFGASAIIQLVPGSIFIRPALVAAGFGLGLAAQSIKVCCDTVVQAHVDDEFRGRTFVFYDILNNVALVTGVTLAALLVPPTGLWLPAFVGMAVVFALAALWFARVSSRLGDETFNRGTELSVT